MRRLPLGRARFTVVVLAICFRRSTGPVRHNISTILEQQLTKPHHTMAAMVAAPNPHDPPDSGNLGVTANIKPTHAPASSAPPPVIPTSLLSVDEQRRLILWAVGLIEVRHSSVSSYSSTNRTGNETLGCSGPPLCCRPTSLLVQRSSSQRPMVRRTLGWW